MIGSRDSLMCPCSHLAIKFALHFCIVLLDQRMCFRSSNYQKDVKHLVQQS